MPASKAWRRSGSSQRAVSMMIGVSRVASLRRSRRANSTPPTPGSIQSRRMRCGGAMRISASASLASPASAVAKPAEIRADSTISRMAGSSSTIRILLLTRLHRSGHGPNAIAAHRYYIPVTSGYLRLPEGAFYATFCLFHAPPHPGATQVSHNGNILAAGLSHSVGITLSGVSVDLPRALAPPAARLEPSPRPTHPTEKASP